MRLSIGEIFKQGSELEGAEQVAFFRKNWTPTLGMLIQYAFEPIYEFDLPEGEPPYKQNNFIDQESNLYAEVRRLYVFFKANPKVARHGGHVPAAKKELLWIQLLENVTPLDAKVLLSLPENKLPYGLTASRMKEIFPGILSADAVGEPVDEPVVEQAEPVVEEPEQIEQKPAPKKRAPAKKKTTRRKTTAKKKPAAKKSS